MLEAYAEGEEVQFGEEESNEFLALYDSNKNDFKASKEVADLNYTAGIMYLNYYANKDGEYSSSFSERVQKAYHFFASNEDISEEFEKKELSECYYQICRFYKNYILNPLMTKEASSEDYDELFSDIDRALESVEDAEVYDKLPLYNMIFMFLYDQRISMAQVDVDRDMVINLLDEVYNAVSNLDVNDPNEAKENLKKNLKAEIIDNYSSYRDAINRAYTNEEEGK